MLIRLAVPLVAILAAGSLAAQEKAAKPLTSTDKTVAVTYNVVQQGDTLKVMSSTELQSERTKMTVAHNAEMKKWNDKKTAAEAAHQKFGEKAPRVTMPTVLASRLKTAADAEAQLSKIKEERAKAKDAAKLPTGKQAPKKDGKKG